MHGYSSTRRRMKSCLVVLLLPWLELVVSFCWFFRCLGVSSSAAAAAAVKVISFNATARRRAVPFATNNATAPAPAPVVTNNAPVVANNATAPAPAPVVTNNAPVVPNNATAPAPVVLELRDWEYLLSSNREFQLGFFSPDGSTMRYFGIQVRAGTNVTNKVIWVANVAKPLIDSSGVVRITRQGNLTINGSSGYSITINSQQSSAVSSNTTPTTITSATLDNLGNFVLRSGDDNIVWQSFDYPSHVWLQGMKLGLFNLNSGKPQQRFLTSWSSQQEPDLDRGNFTLGVDPNNTEQLIIALKRGGIYWSSGIWNGYNFSFPGSLSSFNFNYISNENESYFTWNHNYSNLWLLLDSFGVLSLCSSDLGCDKVVVKCDPDPGSTMSTGCLRDRQNHTTLPRNPINNITLHNKPRKKKQWLTIGGSVASLLILTSLSLLCYLRWRHRCFKGGSNKDRIVQGMQLLMHELNNSATTIDELSNTGKLKLPQKKDRELPFISFSTIEIVTEYFSERNKIGQGGYGPVYKGMLVNGQEIAIKRLSNSSRQGLQEFKNEIILISRLQHRNLVRLLGYCTQKDERILIYEYLPNKSLDFFLFDETKQHLLDWKMRVSIIGGIAQGLLYLHKYSRLRIIHRDLKTSNILLDKDMNPKISDFGTARIFSDNESQANTNRIVGTHGYMSPEYAMDGLFSVKSDVFSFGVMMLEIISGKKNTGFYRPDRALNLLGYAWDLWKEAKGLEIVDQALIQTCSISEAMRYIQVGFLCVQEIAADRPNMLDVVSMLTNETMVLPAPKQLAFSKIMGVTNASTPKTPEYCSINDVTISEVEVR